MKNLQIFTIVVFILFSCSKDDTPSYSLNETSASLFSKTTLQLVIEGATNEKFTYSSENEFIASVDEDGLITGERVGKTIIKVSGNGFDDECEVTVIPKYNTFDQPIVDFGISKEQVKTKEKRTLFYENTNGLVYNGSMKEKYVLYLFENNKLNTSGVSISIANSTSLVDYLAERYVAVSVDPIGFVSVDKKFGIGMDLTDDIEWLIVYVPFDSSKSTKSAIINDTKIRLKELIKRLHI